MDNYHALAMVPLADIFNHHFTPNACLQSDDIVCSTCGSFETCPHDSMEAGRTADCATVDRQIRCDSAQLVEMVLTASVRAGQQVYNTYGRLSNAKLLANYGFMLDANDDDKVCWYSALEALQSAAIDSCPEDWRRLCAAVLEDQVPLDDRISSAEPSGDVLYRSVPDLLYIDADGCISCTLWALLSIDCNYEGGQQDQVCARVLRLCESRISFFTGSDCPLDQLWELASVSRAAPNLGDSSAHGPA